MKFCNNCGKQNTDQQMYCSGCGAALPTSAQAAPTMPAGPMGSMPNQNLGSVPPPQAAMPGVDQVSNVFPQQQAGYPQPYPNTPYAGQNAGPTMAGAAAPKEPVLAAIIGAFFPGLGNWYATPVQQTKGLVVFGAYLAYTIVAVCGLGLITGFLLDCIFVPVGIAWCIYTAVDAYQTTMKVNSGQMVMPWEFAYLGNLQK